MDTTKLSSKGQVIIPKHVRASHHWEVGQTLAVIDTGDGILLKPTSPFCETRIEDVAGCLAYKGKGKVLEEMDEGINAGSEECMDGCW